MKWLLYASLIPKHIWFAYAKQLWQDLKFALTFGCMTKANKYFFIVKFQSSFPMDKAIQAGKQNQTISGHSIYMLGTFWCIPDTNTRWEQGHKHRMSVYLKTLFTIPPHLCFRYMLRFSDRQRRSWRRPDEKRREGAVRWVCKEGRCRDFRKSYRSKRRRWKVPSDRNRVWTVTSASWAKSWRSCTSSTKSQVAASPSLTHQLLVSSIVLSIYPSTNHF